MRDQALDDWAVACDDYRTKLRAIIRDVRADDSLMTPLLAEYDHAIRTAHFLVDAPRGAR